MKEQRPLHERWAEDSISITPPKKKMGRPTENPKGKPIHVRLDQTCQEIIEAYTEQEKVSMAEAIRRGVMKLEEDLE